VAEAVGLSQSTVSRALSGDAHESPEVPTTVTGRDGKHYPATPNRDKPSSPSSTPRAFAPATKIARQAAKIAATIDELHEQVEALRLLGVEDHAAALLDLTEKAERAVSIGYELGALLETPTAITASAG
jgi:hypothetical protein